MNSDSHILLLYHSHCIDDLEFRISSLNTQMLKSATLYVNESVGLKLIYK